MTAWHCFHQSATKDDINLKSLYRLFLCNNSVFVLMLVLCYYIPRVYLPSAISRCLFDCFYNLLGRSHSSDMDIHSQTPHRSNQKNHEHSRWYRHYLLFIFCSFLSLAALYTTSLFLKCKLKLYFPL